MTPFEIVLNKTLYTQFLFLVYSTTRRFRAKGGELQSVLDRDEIPDESDVIRFLRQVLSGLAFLHQYDIAHLDLKVCHHYPWMSHDFYLHLN